MIFKKEQNALELYVCPKCKGYLEPMAELIEENSKKIKNGTFYCINCKRDYPIDNFIPIFLEDDVEIMKEGVAVNYENCVKSLRRQINPENKVSGRLFDQELNCNNLLFLDIGCGIGSHLLILKNNGIQHYSGFDINRRLIEIARNEYKLKNVFVANASLIPFPDNFVDICLLYNVIEHCSSPETVLREVFRILKTGGRLYVDVPNAKSMSDRIFRWGSIILYGKTSHIQKFTKEKVESLINKTGFEKVESKVQTGFYIDYPQLDKFTLLKRFLKFLIGEETVGWEYRCLKR